MRFSLPQMNGKWTDTSSSHEKLALIQKFAEHEIPVFAESDENVSGFTVIVSMVVYDRDLPLGPELSKVDLYRGILVQRKEYFYIEPIATNQYEKYRAYANGIACNIEVEGPYVHIYRWRFQEGHVPEGRYDIDWT